MSIPTCVLTKKGAALLAKTPAGAQVPATRWQIGTGILPAGEELEDMTRLIRPLIYRPITSVTNSGRQSLVLGQFVNEGMDEFYWEELGLWAQDPDEGEILYAVGNARGEGERIEAWTEKIREFVFGMELVFSGTANVTAKISRTLVFATLKDLDAAIGDLAGQIMSGQLSTALMTTGGEIITTTEGVHILAVRDTSIDRIMERVTESIARAKADVTGGLATAILAV